MRITTAITCLCIATPLGAAEFDLDAKVTKAVIFAAGASVTRESVVSLPVGHHRLAIPTNENALTVTFAGTGKVRVLAKSDGKTTLHLAEKSEVLIALQATYESARQNMRSYEEQVEAATARQTAAELRLDFLRSLAAEAGKQGKNQTPLDAQALQGIVEVLGTTAVEALGEISKAKTELAHLQQQLNDLRDALTRAKEALDQATPPDNRITATVIDVHVSEAFEGKMISNGLTDADIGWRPTYKLSLQQSGDTGQLEIKRQAVVYFDSSESWDNVTLVLSTAPLGSDTSIWQPRSQLYGLQDPATLQKLRRKVSSYASADQGAYAPAPVVESLEVARGAEFLGQTLLFSLGSHNDLMWRDNSKQFELDAFSIPAALYGLAVASTDSQAFLYTDFTNDTGGVILSGEAQLYRDGALVGEMEMPQLNPGVETALGLGPLLGMQIEQNILNAQDGESGFISSSSEKSREVETIVTSTLDYPIWVKLLDVLPTSENEALEITTRATPRPNEDSYQGKRGVLAWDLDMQVGTKRTVKFSYKMKWPKDQILTQH